MDQRILILSASVGAGHLRAAQAVELAARQIAPGAEVKNIDVLTLTNAAFRKVYGEAYLDLVNKAPHVLGFFYDHMDKPRSARDGRDRLRLLVEKLNLRSLCDLLECEHWDVIINTHFMPAEIIASLKKKRKLKTPQMTVTTDFETHRLWVNQPCEWFTTATEEGAAYLAHRGVDASTISVTGIPIHPVFAQEKSTSACRKRQGIEGGRPVLLQMAGGFGVGPVQEIFEAITSINTPIELIVVAGKNVKLKAKLEGVKVPPRHRVKVLGFTDQMDELMGAADIVITKPGGLTTSESLARGCAMVVVNPIPGQESRNSDFLLENGCAIKINNLPTLSMKLEKLLGDHEKLASLKANAKRCCKPRAAFDVVAKAMELAGASGTLVGK